MLLLRRLLGYETDQSTTSSTCLQLTLPHPKVIHRLLQGRLDNVVPSSTGHAIVLTLPLPTVQLEDQGTAITKVPQITYFGVGSAVSLFKGLDRRLLPAIWT